MLLAYMAWKDQTRGEKLEPIDGLHSRAALLHRLRAELVCATLATRTKRLRATVDPHSPDNYRTNGVVSNMPEFQEAFHCKTGAPMAPENRCRVW